MKICSKKEFNQVWERLYDACGNHDVCNAMAYDMCAMSIPAWMRCLRPAFKFIGFYCN